MSAIDWAGRTKLYGDKNFAGKAIRRNFVNWNDMNVESLEEVAEIFEEIGEEEEENHKTGKAKKKNPEDEMTILDILDCEEDFEINKTHDADAPERFSSVVNFPNFLR